MNSLIMADFFKEQIIEEKDTYIYGRIIADYGTGYTVLVKGQAVKSQISGRYRNNNDEIPVIGDWVGLTLYNEDKEGLIQRLLTRKTQFVRKIAGNKTEKQVQGANFDIVFIVMALNSDFNVRKLERFLLAAWDTGATPVIILTKADLCDDIVKKEADARNTAPGVNIHVVSAYSGEGMTDISSYLNPGVTIALFGASGVGKSTLINTLTGKEVMAVNRVRKGDEKGTHTTTHREIIFLDQDVMLMDTPGMRELGLWDDGTGVDLTFSDIAALASLCRFTDCSHTNEPGCAVLDALNEGSLDQERLLSYRKLQKEARYIAAKSDERLKMEEQRKWKQISKAAKKYKQK